VNGSVRNYIPTVSALGGSWVDTAAYPSGRLLDSQIPAEVTHAQAVNGWTPALNHMFFVFTAKHEDICFNDGVTCYSNVFCGYHGSFGPLVTPNIYSAMPYTNSLPGCYSGLTPNGDADATINVTSHELQEATDDPNLDAWFDASGNEIGDDCNFDFGVISYHSGAANQVWNGHFYLVQQLYSNKARTCVQTSVPVRPPAP
jgi:hypothetical protein